MRMIEFSMLLAIAQTTTRVSVDAAGVEGDGDSFSPCLSADGRFVSFASVATNLVPVDTNGVTDAFVCDRVSGQIERVSVDSSGNEGNDTSWSRWPQSISADGMVVVFGSFASNLCVGDTNGVQDTFVRDRSTGVTERVSVDSSGVEADAPSYGGAISADARIVAFCSAATNLVPGDANNAYDIFVHDRTTGVTERVSVDSSGAEVLGTSLFPAVSSDGRFIAFESDSMTLVQNDGNRVRDVFVRDRQLGTTERVSVSAGAAGNGRSLCASITGDGNRIAFASEATNLDPNDHNGRLDVFVRDRAAHTTVRCSVDSNGVEGDGDCGMPVISSGGGVVIFTSDATNLVSGDTNGKDDAFVHELDTGATSRVSVDSNGAEGDADNGYFSAISADETVFALWNASTQLVANDTNGVQDVFVRDLCGDLASWNHYGAGLAGSNGVPSIASSANPVLGTTITIDVANSYGQPTSGLFILGFQPAQLPTRFGADLLVLPSLLVPITFSFGGDAFTGAVPYGNALCGTSLFLQAIELDPGATKGVSFTEGLELGFGR